MTGDAAPPQASRVLGEPMERREDPELLTGEATYLDDLEVSGVAHAAVVRSRYAHARILDVDASSALAHEDVLAVFTAEDLDAAGIPGDIPCIYRVPDLQEVEHPLLAGDRARYQGKPVAVVVAETREAAHDAREQVDVSYDRLEAVVEPKAAAAEDAPTIHEEAPDNVPFRWDTGDEAATDEAFAAADETFSFSLENQRVVPNALDPRGAIAEYRPTTGELTVHLPSQTPFTHQEIMSDVLGHPKRKIRVTSPEVGGGFGSKSMFYPEEALVPFCAMQLERPVKWRETRSEAFEADEHGRGQSIESEVAVSDGRVTGLRVRTWGGIGGELGSKGALGPTTTFGLLVSGQYDIPAAHFRSRGVFTNATPTGVYRGVGRAEAIFTIERTMERTARRLGEDPVEFRRRHLVDADAFPFETALGSTYDSGDYEKSLARALERVGYDEWRERQQKAREEGRYLGIGVSCFVESGGFAPSKVSELLGMGHPDSSVKTSFWESGMVRVHETGEVTAYVGTSSQGTGVETTHSQLVADLLGVDVDDVELFEGKDTQRASFGTGSIGSRGAAVGGGALLRSAEKVTQKARHVAAHQFEADPEDVVFEDGEFSVAGAPGRSMTTAEVARAAYLATNLPEGMEPGLEATSYFDPENFTWAFGTQVCVVEVDPRTGEVEFEQFVAVDDCGTQLNPKIVEGQILGGIAQGIGQARFEAPEYDDNGTLLTSTFMDYAVPRAHQLPSIDLDETVTPSPHNPLGVKGVAESGTVGAVPVVVNAVTDALAPFGVEDLDMPLTDETVWRAVHEADSDSTADAGAAGTDEAGAD